MGNFQDLKTVDYHQARRKDPIVTLWRTVLSVAIEDAIKMKTRMIQNEDFWKNKVCTEVLYVTEPNQDFATVCHYADFDHNLIRRKVKETFRKMEESNGKGYMPKVPWKRLPEVNRLRRERPASDRDRAAV
tara:strand:+ start:48 stop:440 length:393 start_codon:yes stop_codon:yes gene_type:complete